MSEVERAVATAMGSPDDLTVARVLIAALRASGFVIVRKEPTAAIVAAGYDRRRIERLISAPHIDDGVIALGPRARDIERLVDRLEQERERSELAPSAAVDH